jgi:hypothetical protein
VEGIIVKICVVTVDKSMVETGIGPTIAVALPTEVIGPVRLALVVTLVAVVAVVAVVALPLMDRG